MTYESLLLNYGGGVIPSSCLAAPSNKAGTLVIGIGGNYAFGGNIPFFGLQIPCIAGAAIFGILLNLLLSIGEKKEEE